MSISAQELLVRIGKHAADLVQDGMQVGLGTGSTAAAMVDALGKRVQDGLSVTGVATSIATRDQALSYGIPVVDLADIDRLDICIDGADEIDSHLNLTKGRGGALLFEKLVARRANHYVIIATADKLVQHLGTRLPLPIEVVPVGWTHTTEAIRELGLETVLRTNDDTPYVTDGGHFIVDCTWSNSTPSPAELAQRLKVITGVVDHGLFIDMADVAITIEPDGSINELQRQN